MISRLLKALAHWTGDLSPTCREAVRLQSLALDGKLSFRQRLGLRIHLRLCQWCRRYGQQIRFLRTAARERTEEPALPQQTLSSDARERIKQRLQVEGK